MLKLFEQKIPFTLKFNIMLVQSSLVLWEDHTYNFIDLLKQQNNIPIQTEQWCGPEHSQAATNKQWSTWWQW